MKKASKILLIVLAAVLVFAGAGAFVLLRLDARAKENHAALANELSARKTWLEQTKVRLTENGAQIGTYTLPELGLAENAEKTLAAGLSQLDLLPEADFEALGLFDRLKWSGSAAHTVRDVTLELAALDVSKPEQDANAISREAPQDAHISLEDGKFTVVEAVNGNTLKEGAVLEAISNALKNVTDTGQAPQTIDAELTALDCYEAPKITTENTEFDLEKAFSDELHGFLLTVNFQKAAPQLSFDEPSQKISQQQAAEFLTLEADGTVSVDEDAVRALVDSWAEAYDIPYTKYRFKSEVDGYVPIQFLDVRYEIDREALMKELCARLRTLDAGEIEPSIVCYRNGEPFEIKDTYIEVDITNQKMTFYKNGERIAFTDVVTGLPDGHPTITGLYYTYYKTTDIWLDGPDYHVFVKYWVSITDLYGLHDASWRSNFGGDIYLYGGSHGCVNTPEEAMKTIYDNVTDGIPILSYHHERPVQEEPDAISETDSDVNPQ